MSRKDGSSWGTYPTRKDRRRQFKGAKCVDPTCRNHGGCPWCTGNRTHADVARRQAADEQLTDYEELDDNLDKDKKREDFEDD